MKNLIFILVTLPLVSFSQTKVHTQSELDHIAEINLLRSNPSAYIDKVKAYISNPAVDSASRRIALEEVIPVLQSTKPMPPLRVNEYCRWMLESHVGVDTVAQEVSHGHGYIWSNSWKQAGENLVCGSGGKVSSSIIVLLIDLGVDDRGHRKTLLDPIYTEISSRRVIFGDESNIFHRRVWWIDEFIAPKSK